MTSLQTKQMAIHILSEWNSQTFNLHLHLFLKILLTKLNIGSGKIGNGKGPVDNKSSQVQVMAWCGMGDKSLLEPMVTQLTDAHVDYQVSTS